MNIILITIIGLSIVSAITVGAVVVTEYAKPPIQPQYPCNSTMDCDWCDSQCVGWKGVNLFECNRTAITGYSCQCMNGYCSKTAFEPQQGLLTFCSVTEWSKFISEYPGTTQELVAYLGTHCDGYVYWLDGCSTEWSGHPYTQSWYDAIPTFTGWLMLECRSVCKDVAGRIVGGRILYEVMYQMTNGVRAETAEITQINTAGPCYYV